MIYYKAEWVIYHLVLAQFQMNAIVTASPSSDSVLVTT